MDKARAELKRVGAKLQEDSNNNFDNYEIGLFDEFDRCYQPNQGPLETVVPTDQNGIEKVFVALSSIEIFAINS